MVMLETKTKGTEDQKLKAVSALRPRGGLGAGHPRNAKPQCRGADTGGGCAGAGGGRTGRKAGRQGRRQPEKDKRGGRGTSIGKGKACNRETK